MTRWFYLNLGFVTNAEIVCIYQYAHCERNKSQHIPRYKCKFRFTYSPIVGEIGFFLLNGWTDVLDIAD